MVLCPNGGSPFCEYSPRRPKFEKHMLGSVVRSKIDFQHFGYILRTPKANPFLPTSSIFGRPIPTMNVDLRRRIRYRCRHIYPVSEANVTVRYPGA